MKFSWTKKQNTPLPDSEPAETPQAVSAPQSAAEEYPSFEESQEEQLIAAERAKEQALVEQEREQLEALRGGKARSTDRKQLIAELEEAGRNGHMVLRTEGLVKKYRQRTVANHVSINVRQGEIVGLLGPNGAGKTTTFYMTTGLVTPNEGKVWLNDVEITKLPVYKRAKLGIGYLPQEASVFRTLTVENNLRLVLQMTKTTPEYQRDRLEQLIEEFHLQKVRKNLGNRLSGGERRRCEIARCLAINPHFIMLDEPFAGVDPIAVEDIQKIVYQLKSQNIGILITDHNAPQTLAITDRAYLLFEGKILFQGTSEELAENPTVREKYLGENFIYHRNTFK